MRQNIRQIVFNCLILLSVLSLSQSMVCPNRSSKCRDDMTCCKWSSGDYGCCPLPSALCCGDGVHCCPNGTKCNDNESSCDEVSDNRIPMTLKLMANIRSDEVCPDKNHTCLASETCCMQRSGGYGCCPYRSGVCCKDQLHCCPNNTRCDIRHKQCIRPKNSVEDNQRMRLIGFDAKNISDIVCPGGRYQCPDNNTCCRINDTQWGCCPILNAVCCDDRIHCCPNGYTCTQSGCQSL